MPYTVPTRVGAKMMAAQEEIFLISSFWARLGLGVAAGD